MSGLNLSFRCTAMSWLGLTVLAVLCPLILLSPVIYAAWWLVRLGLL